MLRSSSSSRASTLNYGDLLLRRLLYSELRLASHVTPATKYSYQPVILIDTQSASLEREEISFFIAMHDGDVQCE